MSEAIWVKHVNDLLTQCNQLVAGAFEPPTGALGLELPSRVLLVAKQNEGEPSVSRPAQRLGFSEVLRDDVLRLGRDAFKENGLRAPPCRHRRLGFAGVRKFAERHAMSVEGFASAAVVGAEFHGF